MRRGIPVAVPIALIAIGLLVACAPLCLDLAYRATAHEEISHVEDAWSAADDGKSEQVWLQARAYNRVLAGRSAGGVGRVLPYEEQLVYGSWPYICYLRADSVGIELPVYHGTSEEALSAGAGHIKGTSLPVGGKGANCCISAHSGIASSSMFDGLRDIQEGDLVTLHTLGRTLGYRVSAVTIVDAGDASLLGIVPGRDLLTLVTCTSDPMPGMPRGGYGVNDRRLVVTCERCALPVQDDAQAPASRMVAPANGRWWPALAAGAVLVALLTACAVRKVRGQRRRRDAGASADDGEQLSDERTDAPFGFGGRT